LPQLGHSFANKPQKTGFETLQLVRSYLFGQIFYQRARRIFFAFLALDIGEEFLIAFG
jgi:hypothetical protein